ncbi:hypothetical protein EON81_08465 [bacterium]|nr:MAG: hypothetical protein EON81_08465 [bacterium]
MIRRSISALALVSILVMPSFAATVDQENPFEGEIKKMEEGDAKSTPAKGGIVFVGSSSIRMWDTLKTDFPGLNVLNRGFGGSQISDSVHYADRIVTKYEPKMVVFFAGTNDLASGKTPETVLSDYKAFVGKVRAKLPEVPIAFLSITPAPSRWNNLQNVIKANTLVHEYSKSEKNLQFVNVFFKMLTETAAPRPELFLDDQLHMKRAGYEIWVDAVRPILPKE